MGDPAAIADSARAGFLKNSGLSVEQFAREIGVTRTSVYFYLNDRSRPTLGTLVKICAVVGMHLAEGLTYCTPRTSGRQPRESDMSRKVHLHTAADLIEEQNISTEEIPKTQIGVMLQQAMDKEGLLILDVAKEFDLTYEYMRRISRGMNLPSKSVLKLLAQRFGWNFKEVEVLLVQDRFRMKNGEHGGMAQTLNPEVEPFERGWHLLEQAQKDMIMAQFNLFVLQNRRHIRDGQN